MPDAPTNAKIMHSTHDPPKMLNLPIRRLAHQKFTQIMSSIPDAFIPLENAQTDSDIKAAEPLRGTILPSEDAPEAEIECWRKAAEQK